MIQIKAAGLDDAGLLREVNEDCVYSQVHHAPGQQSMGLFIVCDGMGGHMGGEFASYWAVEAIKHEFAELLSQEDPRATLVLTEADIEAARSGKISPRLIKKSRQVSFDLESRVSTAIQKANHVVYEYARNKPDKAGNAGTTVAMAAMRGDEAIIANIGDSRTYLLRDHEMRQVSFDHSLVANLVSTGQLLPDEIYTHPQRNVIYRFLGQKGMVQPDIFHETMQPGDYLLLCSDGLWEMLRSDLKMAELIETAGDPGMACLDLVAAAKAAGGEDNIGVVVVKVTD
jgi:serine/threonine protein phosphatase PrpC